MRLSGHTILCLSGQEWDQPAGSNRPPLMAMLAELNRVMVVDPPVSLWEAAVDLATPLGRARWASWVTGHTLRHIAHNLTVWTPPPLPGTGGTLDRRCFARALKELCEREDLETPILWLDPMHAEFADLSAELGAALVVAQTSSGGDMLSEAGRDAIARSDLAFVSSRHQLRRLGPVHAHLVADGIDFEAYNRAVYPDTPIPADLEGLPRPLVAYLGPIDARFDAELWEYAASERPGWGFVAVGPIAPEARDLLPRLTGRPHMRWLDARPDEALPGYLKAACVVLHPWKPGEQAEGGRGWVGVMEAFAAGKPVVTTDPAADPLADRIAGKAGVLRSLDAAVQSQQPRAGFERIQRAQAHTWEASCRHLEGIVLDALARRAEPGTIPLLVERIIRPSA